MSSIFYNNEGAASVDVLTNVLCTARINADVDAFFKYYYYKGASPKLVRNLKNEMKIYWKGKQMANQLQVSECFLVLNLIRVN